MAKKLKPFKLIRKGSKVWFQDTTPQGNPILRDGVVTRIDPEVAGVKGLTSFTDTPARVFVRYTNSRGPVTMDFKMEDVSTDYNMAATKLILNCSKRVEQLLSAITRYACDLG